MSFSFARLNLNHERFTVPADWRAEFFHALLTDAFVNYSNMTDTDFRKVDRRQHRHPIDFNRSKFRDGFSLPAEDVNLDAWQFAVCSGRQTPPKDKWRVYGYLVESTFHIVWLDAEHAMFD